MAEIFTGPADWERWLARHHDTSGGVWLKIAKNGAPEATVSYQEALDVALCYGWIDARKDKLDAEYWQQRFTPRRARSPWSKINRQKAERLIAEGRMQPPGRREVERAKADGRWDAAYDSQRTAAVPDDLQRELDVNPKAAAFFAELDSANRYAILYRLQNAKRPETRAARLRKFVDMLAAGEKLHP